MPQTPARILVVDDDESVVNGLARLLRRHGFEVLVASRGGDAIDLVRLHGPEVVISDWVMPGMSGPELCAALRADTEVPWCYVILLTGLGEARLVCGLDAGADSYLSKPCAEEPLLAHVRAGVRIVRLHRELDLATRRIRDEVEQARAIQQRLLPRQMPEVDGFELASLFSPASECGGDYFDVMELPEGRLLLVVADVCGHGAPAMITTTIFRLLVRTVARSFSRPAQLMEELDRMLIEHRASEHFLTCTIVILDPARGAFEYASAGHPPMLLVSKDGTSIGLSGAIGAPLMSGFSGGYEQAGDVLGPGDSLVLYTDGVIEAPTQDGSEFGVDRLAVAMAGDCTADGRIRSFVDSFAGAVGSAAPDDVTLLVVRRAQNECAVIPSLS